MRASSGQATAAEPHSGGQPRAAVPTWYWLAAAAIIVIVMIGGALFWRSRGTQKLTEKDSVLLADFVNTTGDPVFDGTLKQALAVQLEQSPYLNIVPDPTVRKALQFMGRPADERVTGSIAREICEREHVKAMLSGSISSLGSQYVVALDATNCTSGDSLAQQITAGTKEGVPPRSGRPHRVCAESWENRSRRFRSSILRLPKRPPRRLKRSRHMRQPM